MIILGIESSCDETSVSVIEDDIVKSNLIASQHFHKKFGGVIPELSSRAHLQQIIPLIKSALKESNLKLTDLDCISATAGPGLIGALLVGFNFAKSLSLALNLPFIPVNHIEGHIFSGFLMDDKPEYPYLCAVISGGHTLLLLVKDEFNIIKLGTTNDDAIGEAFDKVSKMLGLGYPGGPELQKMAGKGDDSAYNFPVGKGKSKYDFSFSGLKTAVLRVVQKESDSTMIMDETYANIAASFQKAAVEAITRRVEMALNEWDVKSISVVGGVAANERIRDEMNKLSHKYSKKIIIPDSIYCGDNAAMIAYRGSHFFKKGIKFPLNSNAFPSLPKDAFSDP